MATMLCKEIHASDVRMRHSCMILHREYAFLSLAMDAQPVAARCCTWVYCATFVGDGGGRMCGMESGHQDHTFRARTDRLGRIERDVAAENNVVKAKCRRTIHHARRAPTRHVRRRRMARQCHADKLRASASGQFRAECGLAAVFMGDSHGGSTATTTMRRRGDSR